MTRKLIDKMIRVSYKETAVTDIAKQKFRDHLHDFYEIMIVFKSDISFVSDVSVHHLSSDNLIIIPPLKYHHVQTVDNTQSYKRLVFWFTVNTDDHAEFKQLLSDLSVINFSKNPEIVSYVHLFLDLMQRCGDNHRLYEMGEAFITNLLYSVLYFDFTYEKQVRLNPLVIEVVEYLNTHLNQQITLSDLSKQFACSTSQLAKLFKQTMHISIINYVREKQLLQAKKDIINGKNPTVVCFDYGFNDYSGFYKSFKKQFGVSPSKILKD